MGKKLKGQAVAGSRRAREREVRRRIILEAAARVFADYGYHQATMAAIARAGEISLGGLYALFPGKAHLYGDLVTLEQQELLAALKREISLTGSKKRRLTVAERKAVIYKVAEVIVRYFEENESFFRIYVNESGSLGWNIRASLGDQAFELYEQVVERMVSVVAAGRGGRAAKADARIKALAIIGTVNAVVTEWVSHKKKKPLSGYLSPLRSIISRIVD